MIPRTHRAKAITVGCLIEASLLICLFPLGGMGPHGPTTIAGLIGLLGHLPTILPFEALATFCRLKPALDTIPKAVLMTLAIIGQIVFWSAIASVVMSLVPARRETQDH